MRPDAESPDPTLKSRASRVSRACDRCRIRKIKCNGKTQCNRCNLDDAICVYTKKRRPNDRAHSKEYVQLLEEQQHALVRGVKELYRRSRCGEAFPDLPSGCDDHMLIHEVLTLLNVLPKQRSESFDMDDHQHTESSVASSVCSPIPIQSYFPESRMPVLSTSTSSSTTTASPTIPSMAEFEGFMNSFDSEQIEGIQSLMQSLHKTAESSLEEIFAEPYFMEQELLPAQLPPNSEHFVNPRDTSFTMPHHMGNLHST